MIIDCNTFLGRWPFLEFGIKTPAQLARHLKKGGVSEAWVSAIDSVLYPDPDLHDDRLYRRLQRFPSLHFVKTVNPTLPNWRENLEEWVEQRRVRAVKLFPNYHMYSLSEDCVRDLMPVLEKLRVAPMVQMRIEDERSHYPLMKVPGVPCEDVIALARSFPRVPIIALCAYFKEAAALAPTSPNLHVDLSFMETTDTLATALRTIPARQILFGSYTPHLYTRAAVAKLAMSTAGPRHCRLVAAGNAERLLK